VVGNVSCLGTLYIGPTARIQGDISALSLEIAFGAQINGNIGLLHNSQSTARLLEEKLQLVEQIEGRKGMAPKPISHASAVQEPAKKIVSAPSSRPHPAASDESASDE